MITAGREPRPLVLSLKLSLGLDLDLGEGTIHQLFFSSSLKQANGEMDGIFK